jgi:hypothetical protein
MYDCASLVYLHFPLSQLIIPHSLGDSGVKLDVFVQFPLPRRSFDVLLNLGTGCIEVGPVWIRLE